jgi:putative membrane protein
MRPFRQTSTATERRRTSSESNQRWHLKLGALVAGLVGLGLIAWLFASYSFVRVLDVLAHAGAWGFTAIVAFHLSQMLFSALGWEVIAGPGPLVAGGPAPLSPRPGLKDYLVLRWIREAVNNLLPLAQIGGELVVARLLQRRGVRLAEAIGGTIADLLLEMSTQVLFTVLGVALLARIAGRSDVSELATRALWVATTLVGGAFVALRLGLAALIERAALRMGRALGWPASAEVAGLHAALAGRFRSLPRVALAALWHLISWLLGSLEVCLILHFLGTDIGPGSGLIIESLGQALKVVGFAVPGAIGVQEGGYVLVCRLLNIPPETAIALSLFKRVREVVLGIPGLILSQRAGARVATAPTASL